MIEAVFSLIREERLFEKGERVMIGASGGADSTALVYALHFLRERLGISIHLAHLHHGIRGEDADTDLKSVESLAAGLGLEVTSAFRDIPRLATERGTSVEMAARDERLKFFRDTLAAIAYDKVALAHNLDDQAETVLMRLLRGAGRTGLGGIAPEQNLNGLKIVHPMLRVTHREAVDFLRAHGLSWREDASNKCHDYLRNRIRHKILPLIEEEINPNVREVLNRTADIFRSEEDFLRQTAIDIFESCRTADANGLDAAKLAGTPKALQRRALLHWFYESGVPVQHIDYDSVCAVADMLSDLGGSTRIDLGGGWRVVREYNCLSLRNDDPCGRDNISYSIEVPGISDCPYFGLKVRVEPGRGIVRETRRKPGHLPSSCSISATKLADRPLTLRAWRTGDRMHPYGMDGTRKLQDIFSDCKLPASERDSVPIFECLGEIVWIPGYRIAHEWAMADANKECLHISTLCE